jgi:hypothetical protein
LPYVRLPLVRYEGYDQAYGWGPRENGPGENKTQFQRLTWTFTPRFTVTLPRFVKTYRLMADDGTTLFDYDGRAIDGYNTLVNTNPANKLSFSTPVYTWGGAYLRGDGVRTHALAKMNEVLATSPLASQTIKLKVTDISNRTMGVCLYGPRDTALPKNVQVDLVDYASLRLTCVNPDSHRTYYMLRAPDAPEVPARRDP